MLDTNLIFRGAFYRNTGVIPGIPGTAYLIIDGGELRGQYT